MPTGEITIHDIAKALNVSSSTVSRALKNNAAIGKETIRTVREMAEHLGYQPNSMAANLRQSRTHTVGVIVPLISRPFIASAISGIEQVANEAGLQVLIAQTHDDYRKEVAHAQTMFASRVEGLLVSLGNETLQYDHFLSFEKRGIPVVGFDRVSEQIAGPRIVIDDFAAAFQMTEHLIEQGCRRIAHLAGSQNRENYRNRLRGYTAALEQNGFLTDESLILYNSLSQEAGWEAARQLLNLSLPPDGIFSANDTAAVSTIQEIQRAGLRVPTDIAVAGFNDDPVATIIQPALTTVAYPAAQMGQLAMQRLLAQKEKTSDVPFEAIIVPTQLLIRESSLRE